MRAIERHWARVSGTEANTPDQTPLSGGRLHPVVGRSFPLQSTLFCERAHSHFEKIKAVPWAVAEVAYKVYSRRYGTSQTLERLSERGGFSLFEMDDLYPGWLQFIEPNTPITGMPTHQDSPGLPAIPINSAESDTP